MFYKEFAGIAADLTRKSLDLQTILETFSMRRFADRKFLASSILYVGSDGNLEIVGFYGANLDEMRLSSEGISVFSDHPVAECIRNDSIVCTELPSSGHPAIQLALVAWPIYQESRTIGALVTMMDKGCDDSKEIRECFESLSLLINSAISRVIPENGSRLAISRTNGKVDHRITQEELTERQEVILRLISEGRTNGDIAELLGYSESLIRQETIRIYAHLACNGREEASLIYRSRVTTAK